jgi:hypothetical protein
MSALLNAKVTTQQFAVFSLESQLVRLFQSLTI